MKYDWPSRSAATLAMLSLAAYYSWRGISGHLIVYVTAANIVAVVVASLIGGKNLRRRLAVFVSILCIQAGISFLGELKYNPGTVYIALSSVVFAVNIGALYFLLKPSQITPIEAH
jgi:hypothetical protein